MFAVAAAVFIFAAIVFLVLGLVWREQSPLVARMAALRGDGQFFTEMARGRTESFGERLLEPIANVVVGRLVAVLPTSWIGGIEKRLVHAGQPVSTSGFLFAVAMVEFGMLGMGVTVLSAAGKFSGQSVLILVVFGALGIFLPRTWLENRVRHRQKEIVKSLPDAFDLITVCVEAGLGLDAALARVSEKVEGPFAEELTVCLREVSLGKMRRDALKEMADRTGVKDLIAFINAVVQAETMGSGIAQVLRVQADQMRTLRRQRAEQQAYQAPVKMIFPLVLCIFPTLFIIILGPAGISIYQNFTNK